MKNAPHIIAIDGPAASGKSSVARALARRLGFAYVNSGALYRAITWHVLERGIRPDEKESIAHGVEGISLQCDLQNNEAHISIGEIDPTPHLRDDNVNRGVSAVSAVPRVRQIVDEKLRHCARDQDVVVEGRDIGSVVFPDTPFKFYIDASPEVRLRRRAAEGQQDEIVARDLADSSRVAAPLMIARDAEVIDSSNLSIEEVVNEIVARLKGKGLNI